MSQENFNLLLHERFEDQAKRTPEATALIEANNSASYAELAAQVSQIANALHARGIGRESVVGLYIERSIDWVTSALAILKTNAAVLPLPPSYPPDRLQNIFSQAKLDAVLVSDGIPLEPDRCPRIFNLSELTEDSTASSFSPASSANRPAFILCSSGSTGQPKMIVRTHESFFHRLMWTWKNHPFTDDEVCCQKAPATTTHCIYELFEPLLSGIPTVIVPDQQVQNLEAFWDTVHRRGISRLIIVPSALRASLAMPQFNPPPLKVLVLMGEHVHPTLARDTLAAFPEQTHLYSIYGSTEASSTLVCNLREWAESCPELPLGSPLAPDLTVAVLDADLQPVPPGAVGRLYVGGPALFSKYYADPELTQMMLVKVPGTSGRLFDTRDDVRVVADGNLQFVGRVDNTAKIRGFRVDLLEVEGALLLDPNLKEAAVVVRRDNEGVDSLLAFVTPGTIDKANAYKALRSRIPDYMIPANIIALDQIPLTVNGKVDRMRLLAKYNQDNDAAAINPGTTSSERKVCQAWIETLGHHEFSLDSHFFEVGGTSLSVFSLVNRIRQSFALTHEQLTAQTIYRLPTVASIARSIDDILRGATQKTPQGTDLLVTMRRGFDDGLPPLFVFHSAGGTLGAYERLAKTLTTDREIVGVRDPFIWGMRDPTESFQDWVGTYLEAIRKRQPHGPYYLAAYSSAGAIGFEIAHLLERDNEDVALLALIDPISIDRKSPWRFGWWVMKAVYERAPVPQLVKLAGWVRITAVRLLRTISEHEVTNSVALTQTQYQQLAITAKQRDKHLVLLSALLELNTGLPFALTGADFTDINPDEYLGVLQARFSALIPDVDPVSVERIVVQYYLQTKFHSEYVLQPFGGHILLVEPTSRHAGLLASQFRGHAKNLEAHQVGLGNPSERTKVLMKPFGKLDAHYRCMRDDNFVRQLAAVLDSKL